MDKQLSGVKVSKQIEGLKGLIGVGERVEHACGGKSHVLATLRSNSGMAYKPTMEIPNGNMQPD